MENFIFSASGSQFVTTGPAKILKSDKNERFYGQNEFLNRDFALAGEIIHDYKFSFYSIFFLFEHNNFILCKYFVISMIISSDYGKILRVLKFCGKKITSLP